MTIAPRHLAKNIAADRTVDFLDIWTNKGKELQDDFQPKCRIVGKSFQERHDEKLRHHGT